MEGKDPERNENTNQINDGDMPDQSQRKNSDSLVVDLTSDPFRECQDSHVNTESVEEFPNLIYAGSSEKHASNARLYNVQTRNFSSTPLPRSLTVQEYLATLDIAAQYQRVKPRKAVRVNERGISKQGKTRLRYYSEILPDMTEGRIGALYNRRGRNRKFSKHRKLDGIEQQFVGISPRENMVRQSVPPSSDVPFPEATEEIPPLQSNASTSNPTQVQLEAFEKVLS
nr:hypothetical transcript [Hymenolepis microstoma]